MNTPDIAQFGLIAWLQNNRITLPLKGVEARFDVRGDLVSVELCQIYHQDRAQPLDVLYSFPLPGGAAVYRCEMVVNDRVIAAKVMAVEQARAVAAEKKAAGHRTALMESVRENLFELALGNLAPGDTVVIRMAWFQTLDSMGSEREFRIPFTPGVRYIPGTPLLRRNTGKGTADDTDQVPDASRLTPPRMDSFHPDAAWISIEGRIALEGVDAARIASPTHTLILRESEGVSTARLGDAASVPDRDFVLQMPVAAAFALTPVAWVAEENGERHALVRIIAPDTTPATDTAHDVYFLVDRSGSMGGPNWAATCRAFRAFLGNLAPQDRVWVTFFEDTFRDLAEKPLTPSAILAEPVVQKLEEWAVGGGTELLPALRHVLGSVEKHSPERRAVIVLITDGQVGNEQTIIETMKPLPHLRVFCYGIDTAVNDAFLRRLAAQQRGACCLATPQENMEGKVAGLAARLRHPVLTDLQPPEGWELPADGIPDLHAGECLTVSLRARAGEEVSSPAFSAKDGTGAPVVLTCPARVVTDPAISRLWAKQRIEYLLEKNDTAAAVQLSESANIVCRATAFIAWDESERLALSGPNLQVYQPAMEAGGKVTMYLKASHSPMALDHDDSLQFCLDEPGGPYAAPPPMAAPGRRPAEPPRPFYAAHQPDADITQGFGHLHEESSPAPLLAGGGGRPRRMQIPDETQGPLISGSTPPGWREKLRALTSIKLPETVLSILEVWSVSDAAQAPERRELLERLALLLEVHSEPGEALLAWIKQNVEAGFWPSLLTTLNRDVWNL